MGKQLMTLDLASLDTVAACDKGAEIELRHPVSNAPLGIFVSILGRDSTVFKNHIHQSVNARIRREAMARKRGRDVEILTVEENEQEGIQALILCTTGWRTGEEKHITFNGAKLAFNPENAKTIYTALTWLKKQVDEGVADLENFMKS